MKKFLLDPKKSYYKANLHCHSTISDGRKTPEELKQMYTEQGYSVIAYTDHDVFLDHSDLCDDKFLALNGYEMEVNEEKDVEDFSVKKTCHMCFIALEQDNLNQACYHRSDYLFCNAPKYRHLIKFDESKPDFVREYTPECINKMFAEGRENGFFVTYNHPAWSLEDYRDYCAYDGMNAMEICNYGCVETGYADYNERVYDDMLMAGCRLYCIAADDNHNMRKDSYGGFTVINAEKLEYRTITKAMEEGKLYASQGPEIQELWYEDGKIGIKCSAAASIRLNTGVRRAAIEYPDGEKPLTEAVFDIKESDVYVRLTVTDASGKHANTIAYFIEDLM